MEIAKDEKNLTEEPRQTVIMIKEHGAFCNELKNLVNMLFWSRIVEKNPPTNDPICSREQFTGTLKLPCSFRTDTCFDVREDIVSSVIFVSLTIPQSLDECQNYRQRSWIISEINRRQDADKIFDAFQSSEKRMMRGLVEVSCRSFRATLEFSTSGY